MTPTTRLTLPPLEADFLKAQYRAARVILEYGSGGSTLFAASLPGKRVFSVESDPVWCAALKQEIENASPQSEVTVYPVDIGKTGAWGRPVDTRSWQKFVRYPLQIWSEPFFVEPDLVLIDGRFRMACFATLVLRLRKPATVLFDDYANCRYYHAVAEISPPVEVIGRMARFELTPGLMTQDNLALLMSMFFEATYSEGSKNYKRTFHAFSADEEI